MKTWVVTLHQAGDPERLYFRGRPLITIGEGLLRISGMDREVWRRADSVTELRVNSAAELELFKAMDNKDFDVILDEARRLSDRDTDGIAIAQILEQAVEYYQAVKEVEDQQPGADQPDAA
jgi:hypothetical protein